MPVFLLQVSSPSQSVYTSSFPLLPQRVSSPPSPIPRASPSFLSLPPSSSPLPPLSSYPPLSSTIVATHRIHLK
jgi:hypothetical protein